MALIGALFPVFPTTPLYYGGGRGHSEVLQAALLLLATRLM